MAAEARVVGVVASRVEARAEEERAAVMRAVVRAAVRVEARAEEEMAAVVRAAVVEMMAVTRVEVGMAVMEGSISPSLSSWFRDLYSM